MRLHRQYGNSLSALQTHHAASLQQVSPDGDPSTNGVYPDGTRLVAGYPIDTKSWKALPLGFAIALQYNNQTLGKCFYSVVDTINFADYFQQDI